MRIFRMALTTTCMLCLGISAFTGFAQTAGSQIKQDEPLHGYSGRIELIPNPGRKEVTIVLEMDDHQGSPSNQIVFHLQDEEANMPGSWKGVGRILANSSVVAVLPAGTSSHWMFKFPDRVVPSSVSDLRFQIFPTYGIARYGEIKPLTNQQIHALALTGSPNPSPAS
jgi:hypothetical protein